MSTTKPYGIKIKPRTKSVRPIDMDLEGEGGARVVLNAAKRVLKTHRKVIEALAKR